MTSARIGWVRPAPPTSHQHAVTCPVLCSVSVVLSVCDLSQDVYLTTFACNIGGTTLAKIGWGRPAPPMSHQQSLKHVSAEKAPRLEGMLQSSPDIRFACNIGGNTLAKIGWGRPAPPTSHQPTVKYMSERDAITRLGNSLGYYPIAVTALPSSHRCVLDCSAS